MNNGLLSGYFGDAKIIGTQRVMSYPRVVYTYWGSISTLVAPPEANWALISAEAAQNAAAVQGGPASCYRVPFKLTPTLRYIPVVFSGGSIYIGSDGSDGFDQNYTSHAVPDTMPYLKLADGAAAGGGAIYSNRMNEQTTAHITLNGGSAGQDGIVSVTREGGILASGGGPNSGSVCAPWGTMFGGMNGASLYRYGQTYPPSQNVVSWNLPGYYPIFGGYGPAEKQWVVCEFISSENVK